MTSIVALDIETTGLDPQTDAIIEIGARRFEEQRVEDEWTTLINPGRPIPEFITNLTGISNEMVRNAPSIRDILDEFADFVGDVPILGHNISFDLSFFQRFHLFTSNIRIDTYEIAAVLLPTASRYNLGALSQTLGIPIPATHRAMDDARVTHAVFIRLQEMGIKLPLELIAEIVRLGEPIAWDGNWAFQRILHSLSGKKSTARKARNKDFSSFFPPPLKINAPPIQLTQEPIPLNSDECAALLEYGGPFSQLFEGYEHRPEQLTMLRSITQALSRNQHLMVEAGTGVGKSFAYLIPASLFAIENNTRVVISTNTINLQDQLIKKDIPDLCKALDINVRASTLKGRSNYLCPRRLNNFRHRGPNNTEEMRVLAKILVWLQRNTSGDRTEINLTGPTERDIWMRLSAEDEACSTETCLSRAGGACPFYRVKQAAANAHLLVVNHALLLTDVAVGNRVLPDYDYLIVDEAHHLETATTNALSFRLTRGDIERLFRELGSPKLGLLGYLLECMQKTIRPSEYAQLKRMVERTTDLAFRAQSQALNFIQTMETFVAYQRESQPQGMYAYQERILPATRTLPGWDEIEISWDATAETLRLLLTILADLHKRVGELYTDGSEDLEDIIGNLGNLFRRLTEMEVNISAMVSEPSAELIYWVEVAPNNNHLSLNIAPLHVGGLIEKYLWHEKNCVVLTSATLTTYGDFNYLRNTLNADEADELALGSPFDFENAALLYLVNNISEPNTPEYQFQVERTLVPLCQATGGRALVLFTSYAQLKRTSRSISGPLASQDILVYEQGEGASPNTLLETFRSSPRAVLLGTRSFWEGVDVPGEALSLLVIVKLPFDVPSDPLVASRSEMYDDPFNEYQLPEAILRFRQGFGRLIRTQSDRGVVTILDRRVLTKAYGRAFIDSLPACTVRVGPMADLPRAAAKWLGQ